MPDLDRDRKRALEEMERRQVQLEQAQRELEKRGVVGRSTDRLVTVRARALGGITSVEFHPAIFDEHDEESLAAAVLEAITDVTTRAATIFQETLGDLLAFPELDEPDADGVDELGAVPAPSAAALAPVRHEVPDADAESTAAAAAVASWAGAGMETEQAEGAALGRRSRRVDVKATREPRSRSRTSRKTPERGPGDEPVSGG
jgi:nucleoid-associated protein EbfC